MPGSRYTVHQRPVIHSAADLEPLVEEGTGPLIRPAFERKERKMKLKQVHIQSVLDYEDFMLDFKRGGYGIFIQFSLVCNQTGKSTLLEVLIDLLFGGKADQKSALVFTFTKNPCHYRTSGQGI